MPGPNYAAVDFGTSRYKKDAGVLKFLYWKQFS